MEIKAKSSLKIENLIANRARRRRELLMTSDENVFREIKITKLMMICGIVR